MPRLRSTHDPAAQSHPSGYKDFVLESAASKAPVQFADSALSHKATRLVRHLFSSAATGLTLHYTFSKLRDLIQ